MIDAIHGTDVIENLSHHHDINSNLPSDERVNLYELTVCIQCVEAAGHIIRHVFHSGELHTRDKQHAASIHAREYDLQTIADLRVQELIVRTLNEYKNGKLKLIEEGVSIELHSDITKLNPTIRFLPSTPHETLLLHICLHTTIILYIYTHIIDTHLDRSIGWHKGIYTRNVEYVTTLIGIAVNDRAIAGVVAQPFKQPHTRIIYGAINAGVWEISVPPSASASTSTSTSPADATHNTSSPSPSPSSSSDIFESSTVVPPSNSSNQCTGTHANRRAVISRNHFTDGMYPYIYSQCSIRNTYYRSLSFYCIHTILH